MILVRASTCHASNKVLARFLQRTERLTQQLNTCLVRRRKTAGDRTVDIQNANQFAVRHKRHDQFRARIRIADNVPWKCVHIGNTLRLQR